ncbi:hypothetical protein PHJA_002397000 [Phtheirospermum japonicum]|uniref:FAS1 domain-containing protein n=1 Tax=Phtheirospermum japonicum TaxID=374723 RepID=A0A830CU12_9LAMI|nr:hypothetical protein PHJA_002396900 [Phtheirospermum japonicum]GFQ02530.1 hypothetical protein PHJA_002397000 [Phtheirospermum japonicum]
MRRKKLGVSKLKNPVKVICIIASVSFIIIQIISAIQLTKISPSTINSPDRSKIGEFGKTVIRMLPSDLAFTLFLPSEEAFRRDLRLNRNDSDTYAILTRVLGFSAVPRWISTADLDYGKQKTYDSISGFNLYVSKELNGMVVVNGVVSDEVDLRMGKVLVHVMNGVVMDAEFEQSVQPEDDDEK